MFPIFVVLNHDYFAANVGKGGNKMEHMKDMMPEDVYNNLWDLDTVEIRKGDIQELQEDDYNNLPRTVERVVKEGLRTGYVYKRYTQKDGTVKEYKTGETIKLYIPFDKGDETQIAQVKLIEKYRDAEPMLKAFFWYQMNIDREHLLYTEDFNTDRYNFREHIKKYWAEIDKHSCPRCGGTIYRNIQTQQKLIDSCTQHETITEPFGEYGEFRCVNCLTSFWYCENCEHFHYMMQENCNIPSVGVSMTNPHIGDLVIHNRDTGIVKTEEAEAQEKAFGFYDPTFDPYWLGEERIQNDPLYKALYTEMMEKGGETVFKYEHTRLNQWLTQAERIRQKKTGRKTIDIHNYGGSPQRTHQMTQMEKDLFKLEINYFRQSRGEYRTGTKIFVKQKGDIEHGTVYCSGYCTIQPEKLEKLEEAQVKACA